LDLNQTIQLIPTQPDYQSADILKQFKVVNVSIESSTDMSRLKVNIKLQRIFYYHLTNTYMPTLTLLIITEVTLHFDETKTELAIGLSLTIMLVMYTMYQSISESSIKTAYLKMIDYWLLFCLLMPFFIFMIEIHWLRHTNQNPNTSKKCWIGKNENLRKKNRKIIKCLVHGITIIFIIIYVAIAIAMHREII
jgi:hypothetical protein